MDTTPSHTRLAHAVALALCSALLVACAGGSNLRADGTSVAPASPLPPMRTPTPIQGPLIVDGPVAEGRSVTGDVHITPSGSLLFSFAGAPGFGGYPSNSVPLVSGSIFNAGYLGLDGNVVGSVFNDGTMEVWNPSFTESNSHVRIGGDYAQGFSGTLIVHLGGPEASDLRIAGHASLAGTLRIALPCCGIGDMYNESNYSLTPNILHADGGISGQFDQVVLPSVFVSGTASYGATDVTMVLAKVSAASVAGASADRVTLAGAGTLDSVFAQRERTGVVHGPLGASLDALWRIGDVAQARRSFDSLSGHAHASVRSWMLDDADNVAMRATLPERRTGDHGAWVHGRSGPSTRSDAGMLPAATWRSGIESGIDHWFGNRLLLGLASRTEQADARFARGGDHAQWRSPAFSAYAHLRQGAWHVSGLVGQARAQLDMQRWIDLGDGRHRAGSRLALDRFHAIVEAGREFGLGEGRLLPRVSVSHAAVRSDGFVEHGETGFELATLPAVLTRTSGELGLRYDRAWHWGGSGWMRLAMDAAYQRGLAGGEPMRASFVGAPGMTFALPEHDADGATQRLGLQFELGREGTAPWSIFLQGDHTRHRRQEDQRWLVGARGRF